MEEIMNYDPANTSQKPKKPDYLRKDPYWQRESEIDPREKTEPNRKERPEEEEE